MENKNMKKKAWEKKLEKKVMETLELMQQVWSHADTQDEVNKMVAASRKVQEAWIAAKS